MKHRTKLRERISIFMAKNPSRAILLMILVFNLVFILLAAFVISRLAPSSLENAGFWASVFYTITMILDAGCIESVVSDIGQAGVALVIVCLLIVVVGMVTFTGAVIGYLSNYISTFVENANAGRRRLKISEHTVILNWNSRASEIVNDLLYSETPENVVVLVESDRERVQSEIAERLQDTMSRESKLLSEACRGMKRLEALHYRRSHRLRNRVNVIVREGDPFSTIQLNEVSMDRAKTVVILGKEHLGADAEELRHGDADTVKSLIQVAEITSAEQSANDQRIVVEVEDDWTLGIVERIIAHKQRKGKCNIVPVQVNHLLGQLLSQFSIMPELNHVYSELFSNKGAFFCSQRLPDGPLPDEYAFVHEQMSQSSQAVPLTVMETSEGPHAFYMSDTEYALYCRNAVLDNQIPIALNRHFWLEPRHIVMLGHNRKMDAIMDGFTSFRTEWNRGDGNEILDILVIDDEDSLKARNDYRDYPYVTRAVKADVYDKDLICATISAYVDAHEEDTSILILSDDQVPADQMDAKALTYLIYVQDIIQEKLRSKPGFRRENIDVIIEVLNPKHYDVVHSYSVNNVVISNRYISKMITQIGEKESVFDFYNDILVYDTIKAKGYTSKELYIKRADAFFDTLPEETTADILIRSVYGAGETENRSLILGYIRNETEICFFSGDQRRISVALQPDDKLILFSNH